MGVGAETFVSTERIIILHLLKLQVLNLGQLINQLPTSQLSSRAFCLQKARTLGHCLQDVSYAPKLGFTNEESSKSRA